MTNSKLTFTFQPVTKQKQPPGCSVRKGVLRNFAKFTGKHLCQSRFFNKVVGLMLLTKNQISILIKLLNDTVD